MCKFTFAAVIVMMTLAGENSTHPIVKHFSNKIVFACKKTPWRFLRKYSELLLAAKY
jgi:hypothetical protein